MVSTRAQKTKNKLASPSGRSNKSAIAPPPPTSRQATPGSNRKAASRPGEDSSSEVEYSDSDAETKSVATSASNKTESSREKLQLHIEKQLLIDIENLGGIANFREGKKTALADILNNPDRQEIYGPKAGRTREKIRKRVSTFDGWLKKPGGWQKYYKHLAKIGIKSGAKGRVTSRPSTPAQEPPEAIHEEAEEEVSDLEEAPTPAKPHVKAKKHSKAAEAPSVPAAEVLQARPKPQLQKTGFAQSKTGKMMTTYGKYDWFIWLFFISLLQSR